MLGEEACGLFQSLSCLACHAYIQHLSKPPLASLAGLKETGYSLLSNDMMYLSSHKVGKVVYKSPLVQ